jgi:hypothetical protein
MNIQSKLDYVSNPQRYIDVSFVNKIIHMPIIDYVNMKASSAGYKNYYDLLQHPNIDTIDISQSYERPLTAKEAFNAMNEIVNNFANVTNSLDREWNSRIVNTNNPLNYMAFNIKSDNSSLKYTIKTYKNNTLLNQHTMENKVNANKAFEAAKLSQKIVERKLNNVIEDASSALSMTKKNIRVYADYEDYKISEHDKQIMNISYDTTPVEVMLPQYIRKSKEEYDAEQKNKLENINSTIKEIATTYKNNPEQIAELLTFSARFYEYSARNVMLIRHQNAGTTFFQGFEAWKKDGYCVKRGQRGLKILVPVKTTFVETEPDKYVKLSDAPWQIRKKFKINNESVKSYTKIFFKVGNVFDISQTNVPKSEYPSFYSMGYNDTNLDILSKGIKNYCQDKLQLPVNDIDMNSIALRGFHIKDTSIGMNDKLNSSEYLSTLTHELGHALMNHSKIENTFQKEFEADCFSIMLDTHLGVKITDSRKHHLASNFQQLEKSLSKEGKKLDFDGIVNDVMKKFSLAVNEIDEYIENEINQNENEEQAEEEEEFIQQTKLYDKQFQQQQQEAEEASEVEETIVMMG